jgi:hypothetical protein
MPNTPRAKSSAGQAKDASYIRPSASARAQESGSVRGTPIEFGEPPRILRKGELL